MSSLHRLFSLVVLLLLVVVAAAKQVLCPAESLNWHEHTKPMIETMNRRYILIPLSPPTASSR